MIKNVWHLGSKEPECVNIELTVCVETLTVISTMHNTTQGGHADHNG